MTKLSLLAGRTAQREYFASIRIARIVDKKGLNKFSVGANIENLPFSVKLTDHIETNHKHSNCEPRFPPKLPVL